MAPPKPELGPIRVLFVTARFVLDCSGYGRVLPRLLNLELPSKFPPREALLAHVTDDRRPEGREEGKIWACVHPEGAWIWIIPFSNGKTSIGIIRSTFVVGPDGRIEHVVSPVKVDGHAATLVQQVSA